MPRANRLLRTGDAACPTGTAAAPGPPVRSAYPVAREGSTSSEPVPVSTVARRPRVEPPGESPTATETSPCTAAAVRPRGPSDRDAPCPAPRRPSWPAPAAGTGSLESIGTPWLWGLTIAAVVALFVFDFVATRNPHDVSMREAVGWSAFYIALPLAFGVYVLTQFGTQTGVEYYTGYIVEKSLSVDNLFVFILIMAAFAVPRHLQQRALLWGILGALVLRAVFIAIGAVAIARLDFAFLVFGAILIATAVHLLREELARRQEGGARLRAARGGAASAASSR